MRETSIFLLHLRPYRRVGIKYTSKNQDFRRVDAIVIFILLFRILGVILLAREITVPSHATIIDHESHRHS
jgi:hypothetical protein